MLPNRETDWFEPKQPVGRGAWGIGLFEANRLRQHALMVGFESGGNANRLWREYVSTITIGIRPYCFVRTPKNGS